MRAKFYNLKEGKVLAYNMRTYSVDITNITHYKISLVPFIEKFAKKPFDP